VHALARGCVVREPSRLARGLGDRRHRRLLVKQHGEVTLETVGKPKLGIGVEQLGEMLARVEAGLQIALDGAIESSCRLR
jgi:hypothetical protein